MVGHLFFLRVIVFLLVRHGVGGARGFAQAGQNLHASGGTNDCEVVVVDAHAAQMQRLVQKGMHVDIEHNALGTQRIARGPALRGPRIRTRESVM